MADTDVLEENETDTGTDSPEVAAYKAKRALEEKEIADRAEAILKSQGLSKDNSAAFSMAQMNARLERYAQHNEKKEQGKSDPGGIILKLEIEKEEGKKDRIVFSAEQKKELDFWGWDDDSLEKVHNRLREELSRVQGISMHSAQERLVLELLIASGRTPQELLQDLPRAFSVGKSYAANSRDTQARDTVTVALDFVGISQQYVMRFILHDEFRETNDNNYLRSPANVEDLAYQMAYRDQGNFGLSGKFPTLELRIITDEKNHKIDKEKSRYYINEANVRRWAIKGQHHQYDISPTAKPNYFQEVKIEKDSSMYHVTLGAMFDSENTIFRSEDDVHEYWELEYQMQQDAWIMMVMRQFYRDYEDQQHAEGKISEVISGLFALSPVTKQTFGFNMLYYLSTLPLNFEGSKKGEYLSPDTIVGGATIDVLLSYMHISDFDELYKILGKDSSFFTKEGMQTAMNKHFGKSAKMGGVTNARSFLLAESAALMDKAFIKVGDTHKVIDDTKDASQKTEDELKEEEARKAAFVKFANVFTATAVDVNKVGTVRQALRDAMQEKYGFKVNGKFDEWTVWQAELIAHSMTNWSGISAFNDTGAAGYNAMTKFLRTLQYRLKMATPERGGPTGNLSSAFWFKQMLVPVFDALSTQTAAKGRKGYKTPSEVFHEMQQLHTKQQKEINRLEKELDGLEKGSDVWQAKKWQLGKARDMFSRQYRDQAGQLVFKDDAMKDYAANHFDRAWKLYEQVSGAKEIDFAKFTKTDAYGHQTFQKDAFQKEVQKDFLTHVRYLLHTYGDLDYNMPFRAPKVVQDPEKPGAWKTVWTTMPLGEALFGHELLNRKEFWQKKKGGGWAYDENGRHAIDYKKVQEDKVTLWKTWASMKIAADLKRHLKRSMRDRSVYDQNFHYTYYLNVINALESIPGGVLGDEYDMNKVRVTRSFFSKDDIKNIKKKAGIGTTWFWTRATYDAIRGKDEKEQGWGFNAALAIFASEVIAAKG